MNTSDWIQFSLVIITLWALIWEIRNRRKSSGHSTYLEVSKLFIESSLLLIEKPSLRSLYIYDNKYRDSSDEEKEMSAYCDALIMMLENVWDCYDRGYFRTNIFKGFNKDDGTWFDHYKWFEPLILYSKPFRKSWEISTEEFYDEFKIIGSILLKFEELFIFLDEIIKISSPAKKTLVWQLKFYLTNQKYFFRKIRIKRILKKINSPEINIKLRKNFNNIFYYKLTY